MMKRNNITVICITLMLSLLFFNSCKTDELEGSIFEIATPDLTQYAAKYASSVNIRVNTDLSTADWDVSSDAEWATPTKRKGLITLSVNANPNDNLRTATIKITSAIKDYSLVVNQYGKIDITTEDDVQIIPTGGAASESESGYEIQNSWDGKWVYDGGKTYHSRIGNTTLPLTLEYFFSGEAEINYFVYYPLQREAQFGKFKLYIATADKPEYTLQGEYDFLFKPVETTIELAPGLKPTKIKFEVITARGNEVACDEMKFFTEKLTLSEMISRVFTDVTCTELKPDVSDEMIATMPEYFVVLAQALKNDTYSSWEKDFRACEYKAYTNSGEWRNKMVVREYTDLDNPTGISVQKDDELVVLVGDTYGNNISLQCIGEEKTNYTEKFEYLQPAATGDRYPLTTGVNKLTIKNPGQLFVMYTVADIKEATAKPIKIHIPLGSGKMTGYFDLERHKTDEKYAELISKASHKYFCIRGERIMFYFHTDKLKEVVGRKILPTLDFWNNIIKWQQEMMGIEDVVNTQMNNHVMAISPEGSYMWGGERRIAFAKSTLSKILVPEKVMAEQDNVWGPAHEIGHVNQGAITWASTIESSNNLFSNYTLYKLGKYCTRGAEISKLADSYLNKKSWVKLGNNEEYQNEDADLHMRMNWQLWNYFHRLGNMPDFFPKLFRELRNNKLDQGLTSPGQAQLDFAKAVCKVANMDMTEFFEKWGFFRVISVPKYVQYLEYNYTVTQPMIDSAKAYMASFNKKLPQPIFYLEDRKNGDLGIGNYQVGDVGHYTQFKDNVKITGAPTYRLSGNRVTVNNGSQAVAFEVRKENENGELLYFFNFLSYAIPPTVTINETTKFYAVQADGKRIAMKNE